MFLLLIGAAGLTAACAQSALRDCHTADWFYVGQRDGIVGAPSDIFANYHAVCREAGIEPDRRAYENGHQVGLQIYCTDENGFRVGRNNMAYHRVCPLELEKAFLAGRARGLRMSGCPAKIYVFEEHLATIEQRLKRREQRMTLTIPSVPTAEMARLQQDIDALEALYQRTAAELDDVENQCLEGL
jgi:hypothetical protein